MNICDFFVKNRFPVTICILVVNFVLCGNVDGHQAGKGSIRGKVVEPVTDDLSEELIRGRTLMRYETHLQPFQEAAQPYRLSEKAVVFIESAPVSDRKIDSSASRPQLNQSQMLFHPLVLPVMVGTTVDFPNNDNLFHNVFSYSQPREFDLGRYPRGQKKSVLFDKPGVVKIYCDIHSYMYALILVFENPYFTVPDDDGKYVIDDVPAGKYKLCLWYGRKKVETKNVTIEEGKITVINFNE